MTNNNHNGNGLLRDIAVVVVGTLLALQIDRVLKRGLPGMAKVITRLDLENLDVEG